MGGVQACAPPSPTHPPHRRRGCLFLPPFFSLALYAVRYGLSSDVPREAMRQINGYATRATMCGGAPRATPSFPLLRHPFLRTPSITRLLRPCPLFEPSLGARTLCAHTLERNSRIGACIGKREPERCTMREEALLGTRGQRGSGSTCCRVRYRPAMKAHLPRHQLVCSFLRCGHAWGGKVAARWGGPGRPGRGRWSPHVHGAATQRQLRIARATCSQQASKRSGEWRALGSAQAANRWAGGRVWVGTGGAIVGRTPMRIQ